MKKSLQEIKRWVKEGMTTQTLPTNDQIDTRMKLAIETYAELTNMTVSEAKAHIKDSNEAQDIVMTLCFAA